MCCLESRQTTTPVEGEDFVMYSSQKINHACKCKQCKCSINRRTTSALLPCPTKKED